MAFCLIIFSSWPSRIRDVALATGIGGNNDYTQYSSGNHRVKKDDSLCCAWTFFYSSCFAASAPDTSLSLQSNATGQFWQVKANYPYLSVFLIWV
jgi:hypothetical protein